MGRAGAGWSEYALPEVIDFREGPGIMARDFRDKGVPLVRLAGLSAASLLKGCNYLDPGMVDDKWAHFQLEVGDTVLSTSASLGRVARVPVEAEGAIPYTGIIRMRARDDRLDPDYIQYLLAGPHFQRQVEAMGAGSVMRHFGPSHLGAMTVLVPPRGVQTNIVRILSALDDKTDSNRRLCRTLEQIAQAEFEARFVNFLGVNQLADSDIGEIPATWESLPISELARYVNGKAFTKFGNGRGRMVIRIADLKSGPGGSTVYTDHEAEDDFIARPGDILFAWSGSLDVYRWYRSEALVNQHIFKVIPSGPPDWFVFLSLKHVMPAFQAIAADKATTMGHIKRAHLDEFSVAVPPADKMAEFDRVFAPLFRRSLQSLVENETLIQVRNALLPRLVSGEIQVPDSVDLSEPIEPLVEEHAA